MAAPRRKKLCNQDELFFGLLESSLDSLKAMDQEKPGYLDCLVSTEKITLILEALSRNDNHLLEKVLQAGCNPNIGNKEHFSPLGKAVADCNIEAVSLLLNHGALVDGPEKKKHSHLMDLCSLPCEKLPEQIVIANCLIAHGADFSLLSGDKLIRLLEKPTVLNCLLEAGYNTNSVTHAQNTLLSGAATAAESGENFDSDLCLASAKLLIQYGADVNVMIAQNPPLSIVHMAALYENSDMLKVLLEASALTEYGEHMTYFILPYKYLGTKIQCKQPFCMVVWYQVLFEGGSFLKKGYGKLIEHFLRANVRLHWECSDVHRIQVQDRNQDMNTERYEMHKHNTPFSMYRGFSKEEMPIDIIRLLLSAGSRWHDLVLMFKDTQKAVLIEEGYDRPWTLKHAVRCAIRTFIGHDIGKKVASLGLPLVLKDYVLLRDFISV